MRDPNSTEVAYLNLFINGAVKRFDFNFKVMWDSTFFTSGIISFPTRREIFDKVCIYMVGKRSNVIDLGSEIRSSSAVEIAHGSFETIKAMKTIIYRATELKSKSFIGNESFHLNVAT